MEKREKMITQQIKISEIFADHYAKISRATHLKEINKEENTRKPTKPFTERTETSYKTEKHSTRGKYHTSSDDQIATTRNIEVPTRPI